MKRSAIVVSCVFLACAVTAGAATYFGLASEWKGDGWFEYRLTAEYGAFFTSLYGVGLGGDFTNCIEYGHVPDGWLIESEPGDTGYVWWHFSNELPRVCEYAFEARTAETGFRTNFLYVFFLANMADMWGAGLPTNGVLSRNIAGYAKLGCVAPAIPAEAVASPSNLYGEIVLIPDPAIVEMKPYSLTLEWDYPGTALIAATRDFETWTNVACILLYTGRTAWVSYGEDLLTRYGRAFRAELISSRQVQELTFGLPSQPASLSAVVEDPVPATVGVLRRARVAPDVFDNVFETSAGTNYEAVCTDGEGRVLGRRLFTARAEQSVVRLDLSLAPPVTLLSVRPLSTP